MTLTIRQVPQQYNPARSPTVFVLSSTNVNKRGFGFVGHLFDGHSSEFICSMDIPKGPSGYGVIDLTNYLRSYIDHQEYLRPGMTSFSAANTYAKSYEIQFGEKSDTFSFADSLYGPSGRVLFSGTDSHDFTVGDQVIIRQTPPYLYAEWEGVQTVMDVPDEHSFTIDHGHISGPTTPGTAEHADGRSIVFSGITGATSIVAGYSIPRDEFTAFDTDDFIGSPTNLGARMLTNAPNGFRVRSDSPMWVPVPNNGIRYMRIRTFDQNGVLLGVYGIQSGLSTISHPTVDFCYAGIGPWNIEEAPSHFTWTGSTTIFSGDLVDSYRVAFMESDSERNDAVLSTEELTIKIDRRCQPMEAFTVLFADKMGAWVPWTFAYRHEENHAIKKETFYRGAYGELQGSTWAFNDRRRGVDVYAADHQKSFVVRSDEFSDAESNYFSELKSASHVFWIKSSSVFLPVVMEDEKWERLLFDQEDEQLRGEITFALAYRENTLI